MLGHLQREGSLPYHDSRTDCTSIHQGNLQDSKKTSIELYDEPSGRSAPRMKRMFFLLLLLFLAVPLAEIFVIVQVAQDMGLIETVGLLLIVSIVGAWLVKTEGMGVVRKIQFQLIRGEIPSKELLDGGLILIAGVLMLTPGFVTDIFGLLLLFPLTRPIIRHLLFRRITAYPQTFTRSNLDRSSSGFGEDAFMHVKNIDVDIVDLRRTEDTCNDPPSLEE